MDQNKPKNKRTDNKKYLIVIIVAVLVLAFVAVIAKMNPENNKSGSKSVEDLEESADMIQMLSVIDMVYPDAINALSSAGFTNITSNVDQNSDETLWYVVGQSVDKGKSVPSHNEIMLTCATKCKLYIDIYYSKNRI